MVNTWTGKWTEEADYSTYPKEKLCDYDRMAIWIRRQGYEPKTSMENLIDMIFAHFNTLLDSFDDTEYDDCNFIEGCKEYVEASGGIKEFDYYC